MVEMPVITKSMKIKAVVQDTVDGKSREIVANQILCNEGVPYAVFSSDSQMRYEDFELIIEEDD